MEVNWTYWPVLVRRTDSRPDDSVAKFVCPNVRRASVWSSVPVYWPSSASYVVYGTAAPRPTVTASVPVLLSSFVSATTPVASAVAVTVTPPFVAVHEPLGVTVTVAPAGTAGVVPLSVVDPATTRVTDPAATGWLPRLRTWTENVTTEPTDGLAGFEDTETTSRSGPGASPTTSFAGAVNALSVSSCSTTVFAGSTTAPTVYSPAGRVPAATWTCALAPGWSAATAAEPAVDPPSFPSRVVADDARSPVFFTVAVSVTGVVAVGDAGDAVTAVTVRLGFGAGAP